MAVDILYPKEKTVYCLGKIAYPKAVDGPEAARKRLGILSLEQEFWVRSARGWRGRTWAITSVIGRYVQYGSVLRELGIRAGAKIISQIRLNRFYSRAFPDLATRQVGVSGCRFWAAALSLPLHVILHSFERCPPHRSDIMGSVSKDRFPVEAA
jgi:hypothetical protein